MAVSVRKRGFANGIRRSIVMLGILAVTCFLSGCLPSFEVENLSDQTLTFAVNGVTIGTVGPESVIVDAEKTFGNLQHYGDIETVTAWNEREELVLLRQVSMDDFIRTGEGYRYRILADIPRSGPSSINMMFENDSPLDVRVKVGKLFTEFIDSGESIEAVVPVGMGSYYIEYCDYNNVGICRESIVFTDLAELQDTVVTSRIDVPYQDITFRNNTGEPITLYVDSLLLVEIPPGDTVVSVPWYGQASVTFHGIDENGEWYVGETIARWENFQQYTTKDELEARGWITEIPYSQE